ncbi:MAG: hypothetical protein ACRDNK_08890 [Solirubrobacteraceae bacterium]
MARGGALSRDRRSLGEQEHAGPAAALLRLSKTTRLGLPRAPLGETLASAALRKCSNHYCFLG